MIAYQVGDFQNKYPHLTQRTRLDSTNQTKVSLKSTITTDHSFLVDWDGELGTEDIDLQSIWNVGLVKAKNILLSYSYSEND